MAHQRAKTLIGITLLGLGQATTVQGQSTSATALTAAPPGISSNSPSQPPSWLVKDPRTGRVYEQHPIDVTVPVTKWQAKAIEQTVYEPATTSVLQNKSQTTFVPQTQYVMQARAKGWWNPLRPPVQAYEYVPVTQWVPRTQMVPFPVPTQQWVPKRQSVVVYQPVQTIEVRKRLVQRELPQPNISGLAATPPPPQLVPGTFTPQSQLVSGTFSNAGKGLAMRPVRTAGLPATILTGTYSAPLNTSASSNVAVRDSLQVGLQPTVLR